MQNSLVTRPGRVVVLNGPSSGGKTTVARALQRLADEPWLHLGIDVFVAALDSGRVEDAVPWDGDRPQVQPLALQLVAAMRASVAAAARAGVNVISDDLFLDPSWEQEWRAALRGVDALIVCVDAAPDELDARERARGDRLVGVARKQRAVIHTGVDYDLRLDTSESTPDECATAILTAIAV